MVQPRAAPGAPSPPKNADSGASIGGNAARVRRRTNPHISRKAYCGLRKAGICCVALGLGESRYVHTAIHQDPSRALHLQALRDTS